MSRAADDQVRADVEQWLQSFVRAGLAVPLAVVGGMRRCLGSRFATVTDRLAEPVRMVRSIFEAATGTASQAPTTVPEVAAPPAAAVPSEPAARPPSADGLPIEEYESLAASHVVARLPSLTRAELRRVRRFELANRGRRTVVGKIDQLLA